MPLALWAASTAARYSSGLHLLVGVEGSVVALLEGRIMSVVQTQLRPLTIRTRPSRPLALNLLLAFALAFQRKDSLASRQGDSSGIPRWQVLDGSEPCITRTLNASSQRQERATGVEAEALHNLVILNAEAIVQSREVSPLF